MMMFLTPWSFLIWALCSWVIGMLGRDTRFGFAGNFLIAFVFSPLVGVIVLLAADRWRRPQRDPRKVRSIRP
jgi:predicted membrane protein